MARIMGTQFAQEQAKIFRARAAKMASSSVATKLTSLADRLDQMAPEFYFEPLEGNTEMEQLSHGLEKLRDKLDACEQTGGDLSLCTPFFREVESILEHHR